MPPARPRLRLPASIRACLFDLDGVLTSTQEVHRLAWKQVFDTYLHERAARTAEPFVPFDAGEDYAQYVDGKPRSDGVRSFLEARGIRLAEGTRDDPPGTETVSGIGNRKNELVLRLIRESGVHVYRGSLRFLRAVRAAGLRTAVCSSSANAAEVLRVTGLDELIDVRVDGVTLAELHLPGKPAPDMFLEGARRLGVAPAEAAVFEDAIAGVAAGRAGHFGYVVGVDRGVGEHALLEHGADIVVHDLAELLE